MYTYYIITAAAMEKTYISGEQGGMDNAQGIYT